MLYNGFYIQTGNNIPSYAFEEKRDCYKELENYFSEYHPGKICALYGLRRTGKTVLMSQFIHSMSQADKAKAVYIDCREETSIDDLYSVLEHYYDNGSRYFFIDEITMLKDFQPFSNILADIYSAKKDAKIVIAGTDSLGIKLAARSALFDRIIPIHTSYVSFPEFERLLNKHDIDEYVEFGGTLTTEQYKDYQAAEEYSNSAIVENILHSLEKHEEVIRRRYATLTELYDKNELTSVIQKMLNRYSHNITLKAIARMYKNAALYSTLIEQDSVSLKPFKTLLLNPAEINSITKEALHIKDNDETSTNLLPADLDELKTYLLSIEILMRIPYKESFNRGIIGNDIEIITQPGMMYSQTERLLDILSDNATWIEKCSIDSIYEFTSRAKNFTLGILLEDLILIEAYKQFQKFDNKRYYVSNLSVDVPFDNNVIYGEADLIIFDKEKNEVVLFEIKHSNQIVYQYQTKHLTSEAFLSYVEENFGKVTGRYVVYKGATDNSNDIPYLNVEEYLKYIHYNAIQPEMTLAEYFNAIIDPLPSFPSASDPEENEPTTDEKPDKSDTFNTDVAPDTTDAAKQASKPTIRGMKL